MFKFKCVSQRGRGGRVGKPAALVDALGRCCHRCSQSCLLRSLANGRVGCLAQWGPLFRKALTRICGSAVQIRPLTCSLRNTEYVYVHLDRQTNTRKHNHYVMHNDRHMYVKRNAIVLVGYSSKDLFSCVCLIKYKCVCVWSDSVFARVCARAWGGGGGSRQTDANTISLHNDRHMYVKRIVLDLGFSSCFVVVCV